MATVMHRAVEVDEKVEQNDVEMITKLSCENQTLRELLNISGHPKKEIERLKRKEHLEEEKLLMNGDVMSSDERSLASSSDEMEDGTGTVRRRGKNGGPVAVAAAPKDGGGVTGRFFEKDCKRSSVIEIEKPNKMGEIEGDLDWRTEGQEIGKESLRNIENSPEGQSSPVIVRGQGLKVNEADGRSGLKAKGHEEELYQNNENGSNFVDESVSNEIEAYEGKSADSPGKDSLFGVEQVNPIVGTECPGGNAANDDGNRDTKTDRLAANEEVGDGSDEKRKQEDFLDLYNSEGILVEETEEPFTRKKSVGSDSKMAGIKIRRSTKQKRVIQADLKSYFQNEDGVDRGSDGESSGDGKGSESSKSDGSRRGGSSDQEGVSADTEQRPSELRVDNGGVKESAGLNGTDEVASNDCIGSADTECLGSDNPDHVTQSLTGNRIVNIDYSFSPPESPIDSPDFHEKEASSHRTIQLDYSDSDSDDPELMVEDQFGDIGGESDSSSDGSDRDAGADELDMTEEELIGTLDEGGEFVISTWTRPAEECDHLDEGGDRFMPEEGEVEPPHSGGVAPIENDFAFTKAFLQKDQFTGGSIEAKFARRKRYGTANRANAVTLFAGADGVVSPRGNIRSDSDLTLGAENHNSDLNAKPSNEKDNNAGSSVSAPDISIKSENPSETALKLSNSSSGEIDPTIFMNKLSAQTEEEPTTKAASDLTNLLSDLDAALELEDSD